mmetsp:Transcript_41202/g.106511  ORF Transcript_41202/g.106511 Transcript_41202/m.106511 type:complete len:98 (-) Transcript_41202:3125-3418(-)
MHERGKNEKNRGAICSTTSINKNETDRGGTKKKAALADATTTTHCASVDNRYVHRAHYPVRIHMTKQKGGKKEGKKGGKKEKGGREEKKSSRAVQAG